MRKLILLLTLLLPSLALSNNDRYEITVKISGDKSQRECTINTNKLDGTWDCVNDDVLITADKNDYNGVSVFIHIMKDDDYESYVAVLPPNQFVTMQMNDNTEIFVSTKDRTITNQ
ncbi:hypothetical protein L1D13_13090 [Vibrio tubiashii]|uniref:hypothetical protein n=1 Tax=Vibrio TaxID=662 RepID=UPI001A2779F0|nr:MULTISPECIES: hypothetical protein [Vibrio]EMA9023480.1 hypothetical protein [Vibrio cholerae]HAS6154479.1 hypothetical protein [Vibrio vulnificus]EMB2633061.1 hypothetical protein [Vibrio cholerae]MCG9584728.1 hypothetical protein [Vibrio tubiashii]MCG9618256.1 hypothetical protein [Vibrio tubiashii]